jgi:hypothetical protein
MTALCAESLLGAGHCQPGLESLSPMIVNVGTVGIELTIDELRVNRRRHVAKLVRRCSDNGRP